jgi:hypothetical protein
MAERPVYLVALRAEGDGPPPAVRLRRLLKCCLRAFGLRALRVEEMPPTFQNKAAAGDDDQE